MERVGSLFAQWGFNLKAREREKKEDTSFTVWPGDIMHYHKVAMKWRWEGLTRTSLEMYEASNLSLLNVAVTSSEVSAIHLLLHT